MISSDAGGMAARREALADEKKKKKTVGKRGKSEEAGTLIVSQCIVVNGLKDWV